MENLYDQTIDHGRLFNLLESKAACCKDDFPSLSPVWATINEGDDEDRKGFVATTLLEMGEKVKVSAEVVKSLQETYDKYPAVASVYDLLDLDGDDFKALNSQIRLFLTQKKQQRQALKEAALAREKHEADERMERALERSREDRQKPKKYKANVSRKLVELGLEGLPTEVIPSQDEADRIAVRLEKLEAQSSGSSAMECIPATSLSSKSFWVGSKDCQAAWDEELNDSIKEKVGKASTETAVASIMLDGQTPVTSTPYNQLVLTKTKYCLILLVLGVMTKEDALPIILKWFSTTAAIASEVGTVLAVQYTNSVLQECERTGSFTPISTYHERIYSEIRMKHYKKQTTVIKGNDKDRNRQRGNERNPGPGNRNGKQNQGPKGRPKGPGKGKGKRNQQDWGQGNWSGNWGGTPDWNGQYGQYGGNNGQYGQYGQQNGQYGGNNGWNGPNQAGQPNQTNQGNQWANTVTQATATTGNGPPKGAPVKGIIVHLELYSPVGSELCRPHLRYEKYY